LKEKNLKKKTNSRLKYFSTNLRRNWNSRLKYFSTNLRRNWKDCYYLEYCQKDNRNKEKKKLILEKEVIYFKYNKPGYYTSNYSDLKKAKKTKI
jgi:hypothetical protein